MMKPLVFSPLLQAPPASPAPPQWALLLKAWGLLIIQTLGFLAFMALMVAPLWWLTP